MSRCSPASGGVAHAGRQGQGPHRADGHHRAAGPALPGDAARRCACSLVLAKYAAFGVIPLVIPSILDIPPIPIAADPAAAGHRLRLHQGARRRGRLRLLHRARARCPAHVKAYWGPEIRVGAPQPALTANMDAHTNVEQLSFNFDKETQGDAGRLHPGADQQGADPASRSRTSRRSTRRSALVPPLPPKIEKLERHRAPVRARRR